MILKEFCIYDSKAEAALPKFLAPSTGLAVRMIEEATNNPEQQFHKHAADYTLFELGEFDCSTMKTTNLPTPLNLGVLKTFITAPTREREDERYEAMYETLQDELSLMRKAHTEALVTMENFRYNTIKAVK